MAGGRARAVLVALTACGALGLASCGGSGHEYVSNTDEGLFLRVPDDWSVIDVDTDDGMLSRPGVPADWARVMDASPSPGINNYLEAVPVDPVGIAVVEPIETYAQRDGMTLEELRSYALTNYVSGDPADPSGVLDPLTLDQQADGPVEVVDFDDNVTFEGGYRGQRIVFNLELDDGRFVTIDQSAVVDVDTTEVYRLLIKCEARCYADRRSEIDEIVDSWTIEKD